MSAFRSDRDFGAGPPLASRRIKFQLIGGIELYTVGDVFEATRFIVLCDCSVEAAFLVDLNPQYASVLGKRANGRSFKRISSPLGSISR